MNDWTAAEPSDTKAPTFPAASVVAKAGWTDPSPALAAKVIPILLTGFPSTSARTSSGIGSPVCSGPLWPSPFVFVNVRMPVLPASLPTVNVLTPSVGGRIPAGEPLSWNNTSWWSPVAAEDGIDTNAVISVSEIVTLWY